MQNWEYKVVRLNSNSIQEVEDYLQILGEGGWELVTVVNVTGENGATTDILGYFKRSTGVDEFDFDNAE